MYPLPDPQKTTLAQEDAACAAAEAQQPYSDPSKWRAMEGDEVLNLTTLKRATVITGLQDGRILVTGDQRWERWNTEVIIPNIERR